MSKSKIYSYDFWYICRLNNKTNEDAESPGGTTRSQPAQDH